MTHELTNLAMVLEGVSVVLEERQEEGRPPDLEEAQELRRAGERLVAFTRRLRSLARLATDAREHLDLRTLVGEALDLLELVGLLRHLRLKRDFPGVPIYVKVSPQAASLVLVNLLANLAELARDLERGELEVSLVASPGSGKVVCRASAREDAVLDRLLEPGALPTGLGHAYFRTRLESEGARWETRRLAERIEATLVLPA